MYLKKALMLAWTLQQTTTETYYYEKLAVDYFNIGDHTKSQRYKNRSFYGQLEEKGSLMFKVAEEKDYH